MAPRLGALGSLESKVSFDDRLRRVDEDLIRIWNFEDHGNVSACVVPLLTPVD